MLTQLFHLHCSDGHQMPAYAWLPVGEPRCVLYISHGMSEYAERYAHVAANLVTHGIAVFAHDHRAHGSAVANIDDLGIADENWFYQQIEDIRSMVLHLRKTYPDKKLFLFGHSMGSFILQRFFQLYGGEIDGLVLSATNGKPDPLLPFGIALAWVQMKMMGHRYRSLLIDKLSFQQFNKAFAPNRTNHDWLSRNTAEVDKYVQDAKCGFVCNATFFYYFFKGIHDAFSLSNIKKIPTNVPIYVFAGDKDPVGFAGKGFLQFIQKWKDAGVKDLVYKLYPEGRHEMLNDINREEVIQDLTDWINKKVDGK